MLLRYVARRPAALELPVSLSAATTRGEWEFFATGLSGERYNRRADAEGFSEM